MTNIIDVRLDLTFGFYQNKTVSLVIQLNGTEIFKNNGTSQKHTLAFQTTLPLRLEFFISGKNPYDTLIDDAGKILEDKFVRVDALSVNGLWVEKWLLESSVFQVESARDSLIKSNYFGQNGKAVFEIPHTDLLDFWLDLLVDQ